MSSREVNCEKMSTLWPLSLSSRSIMSRRRSLPEASMRVWSVMWLPCASLGSKWRNGCSEHLRSCMRMLFSCVLEPVACSSRPASSPLTMDWYISRCGGVIGTYTTTSFLLGRLLATSDLRRRIMKGARILCSLLTMLPSWCLRNRRSSCALDPTPSNAKTLWKNSRSSKISGMRKLRRLQSSLKLFCRGVPVSRILLAPPRSTLPPQIRLSSRMSRQRKFLRRWPSSTITCFH
mmetsp:Transcript_17173/g.49143  ORF Transcript_17173/g.49143 Transcript_17173/m.49143 type:complete len:234 (-) Transcript_17173:65-766(-)